MNPSGKIVLLVDDNALNRELLNRTLQTEQYTILEAEDGIEALAVLEHQQVDIIISDVLMPNLDGYGLCTEVRRRPELRNVFLILYSATNFSPDDEIYGLNCGADRFVDKQGTPKVILKTIDEVRKDRTERGYDYLPPENPSHAEVEMKRFNAVMIRQLEGNSIVIERARAGLQSLNEKLEERVRDHTAKLAMANQGLETLSSELDRRVAIRTRELAAKNSILEARAEELELRTKELISSNADLEQFASAASHDLQEPLRAVSGCIQVFERNFHGKIDENSDKLIQTVVNASSRMKSLIEGILSYSKAGQADNLQTIDTGAVLRQLLVDLSVAITETKTEVVFSQLPSLRFVKTQFEQLLRNLVGNAIKYRNGPGHKVSISAERQIDCWIFSVADNGIGFKQQYAEEIFNIFRRLHTQEEYIGTGIGLTISKKIVEGRGGKIWAESSPDHGSTFFFSVPDSGDVFASYLSSEL
jgi:signal transduction histidine kinase